MNRLKELRIDHGDKQEDIAKLLGVSTMTISRWEKDKELSLKHSQAKQLAEYFGVQVSYLLGESDFRTWSDEDFFHTTGYPLNMSHQSTLEDFDTSKEDEDAQNRVDETYLRFITDTEKLKILKSDTLVAFRFVESIRNNLRHGIVKPYSYAWEMDKISFQLLDLLERIEQREKELKD
ncbi:helix-turn-helix transcriptional regulator [Streptococcus suis]|uniref:helix-turn-helix transcriptional regulator n=2 Tax=Streptococcus suis TaxID=1307 RepID=UPI000CF74F74|nr:helix-turn-helix transcriptional regulator [Streptococcus suis]